MKMKISEKVTGMSLEDSIRYALKSSRKKGALGVLLAIGGIVGTWLLCDAIEEKAYAVGMADCNHSYDKVLRKLYDKGDITWEEVCDAADEVAEENGVPPLGKKDDICWEDPVEF